ncbi:unnamed protein product, partial [Mesorhabditis belari]|uniref:Uncharacterized protein n=1 Tax=Mesorhabditis belari TaxID=2138241 RepID=A0AAF3EK24_9BILA
MDSLRSFWDVLYVPATNPRRQKVIYLATDCSATMDKFYLNYWEQLKWFMDNNKNPEVASMFGLILLGTLIDNETESWPEMIQKYPVTGKFFSYKEFSGIHDDSISNYFGLCEPLPGEPPASMIKWVWVLFK